MLQEQVTAGRPPRGKNQCCYHLVVLFRTLGNFSPAPPNYFCANRKEHFMEPQTVHNAVALLIAVALGAACDQLHKRPGVPEEKETILSRTVRTTT